MDVQSVAFAQERQARILELLEQRGRIRNSELATLLRVTEATVRKDVARLARQRRLTRTHGGVIALRPSFEPDLTTRVARNAAAKSAIARSCLAMIRPGDAIYLDGGSTVLRIAELLAADVGRASWNVNVLTNALGVAQALADHPGIRHTVLGGTYRSMGGSFVGPLTVARLTDFTVNIAFIGVTGLSEQGFTVADLGEAQVKSAVIERARRVVVPMDRTKIGATDFAKVCGLDAVTTIVIDGPNEYLSEVCTREGVELVIASVPSPSATS